MLSPVLSLTPPSKENTHHITSVLKNFHLAQNTRTNQIQRNITHLQNRIKFLEARFKNNFFPLGNYGNFLNELCLLFTDKQNLLPTKIFYDPILVIY